MVYIRNRNQDRNLAKVGTGAGTGIVKNSYGSTTLAINTEKAIISIRSSTWSTTTSRSMSRTTFIVQVRLRSLNHRNRNFFAVANGKRNLITDLSGPGTVIKWNHRSSHRHSIKWCTGIWVLSLKIFYSHFTINLTKLINFFPVKSLLCKKAKILSTFFLENCFLWSRYGAGTGAISHNLSKVAIGT